MVNQGFDPVTFEIDRSFAKDFHSKRKFVLGKGNVPWTTQTLVIFSVIWSQGESWPVCEVPLYMRTGEGGGSSVAGISRSAANTQHTDKALQILTN